MGQADPNPQRIKSTTDLQSECEPKIMSHSALRGWGSSLMKGGAISSLTQLLLPPFLYVLSPVGLEAMVSGEEWEIPSSLSLSRMIGTTSTFCQDQRSRAETGFELSNVPKYDAGLGNQGLVLIPIQDSTPTAQR